MDSCCLLGDASSAQLVGVSGKLSAGTAMKRPSTPTRNLPMDSIVSRLEESKTISEEEEASDIQRKAEFVLKRRGTRGGP